ncbi:hypothetical protein QFC20_006352 [Naganishia adeliensis]|uniref:Uncharacterized protein n=1 Tax=Naganishia adeliensis TaxID=92952 RepID=A0ACC2VC40_9TREE|nr:hypothetical protein QFC20_006352 [Naganishia adeliensis]
MSVTLAAYFDPRWGSSSRYDPERELIEETPSGGRSRAGSVVSDILPRRQIQDPLPPAPQHNLAPGPEGNARNQDPIRPAPPQDLAPGTEGNPMRIDSDSDSNPDDANNQERTHADVPMEEISSQSEGEEEGDELEEDTSMRGSDCAPQYVLSEEENELEEEDDCDAESLEEEEEVESEGTFGDADVDELEDSFAEEDEDDVEEGRGEAMAKDCLYEGHGRDSFEENEEDESGLQEEQDGESVSMEVNATEKAEMDWPPDENEEEEEEEGVQKQREEGSASVSSEFDWAEEGFGEVVYVARHARKDRPPFEEILPTQSSLRAQIPLVAELLNNLGEAESRAAEQDAASESSSGKKGSKEAPSAQTTKVKNKALTGGSVDGWLTME